LLESCFEVGTAVHEFDQTFFRSRKQDVKILDLCFEAKFLEFRGNPLRVVFVIRRSNIVRMGGQALHVRAMIRRIGNRAHLFFPWARVPKKTRAKTKKGKITSRRGMQERQESHSSKQTDSYQRCTLHESPVEICKFN